MSKAAAVVVLGFWYLFNLLTVVGNKYIIQVAHFNFPFTLTAIHMLCCFVGSVVLVRYLKLQPYQPISMHTLMTKVLPVATTYCANIALSNVSLKWIPVSFMQTVKSSVPAFNVLGQYLFLGQRFSNALYATIVPVVGGVWLASYTEVNFDAAGFAAAIVSSIFTAAMAILSGQILTGADRLSSFNLVLYMSPIALMYLLPFAAYFEFSELFGVWLPQYGSESALAMLVLSGIVAVLLNVASFLAIAYTSSLTVTVAGNFKAVINIVISVMIFKNEITPLNALGCAITVAGVAAYSHVQNKEQAERERAEQLKRAASGV